MEKDIFQTIEAKFSTFSKSKQQIATYILQNPNEAAFQTAAQIGKAVRISESTVVRFASDLGYKGFPSFQKCLQQVLKDQLLTGATAQSEQPLTEESDPFFKEPISSIQGLQQLLTPNARSFIENTTKALEQCGTLYLLGTPLGELILPLCKYLAEKVMDHVRILCTHCKEELFYDMSRLQKGDRILILGLGELSTLVKFVIEQCSALEVGVILLTDQLPSTDAKESVCLYTLTPQKQGSLPDFTQSLTLIRTLFSHLQNQCSKQWESRNTAMEDIKNAYYSYEWYST